MPFRLFANCMRHMQSFSILVLLATPLMIACGRSDAVIDPNQLSAEEAEKLRIANEDYADYMDTPGS
jgi:hypothetical protein